MSFAKAVLTPAMYFSLATIATNYPVIIITFHTEIPRICLQTEAESTAALPLKGNPSQTELTGGSVDKAIAANVSIIKLIHKS